MNRAQRRASRAHGRQLMKQGYNEFKDITHDAHTMEVLERGMATGNITRPPVKVWKNNMYIVQCFREHNNDLGRHCIKAMVRRNDESKMVEWGDLQRIKNEIFGEDVVAYQIFPRQSQLTDVANLYWLWVPV